jgi:hypothetical protein
MCLAPRFVVPPGQKIPSGRTIVLKYPWRACMIAASCQRDRKSGLAGGKVFRPLPYVRMTKPLL